MLIPLLFWLPVTLFTYYNKIIDNKNYDMYMSSTYITVLSSIYMVCLNYCSNDTLYELVSFSALYFMFNFKLTTELLNKIYYSVTLFSLVIILLNNKHLAIILDNLIYSEVSVILLNYMTYLERKNKLDLWYMMVYLGHIVVFLYTRIYKMINLIIYILYNISWDITLFFIFISQLIILLGSSIWIYDRIIILKEF